MLASLSFYNYHFINKVVSSLILGSCCIILITLCECKINILTEQILSYRKKRVSSRDSFLILELKRDYLPGSEKFISSKGIFFIN